MESAVAHFSNLKFEISNPLRVFRGILGECAVFQTRPPIIPRQAAVIPHACDPHSALSDARTAPITAPATPMLSRSWTHKNHVNGYTTAGATYRSGRQ
jgi:hypothetical protein